jgi:hypothetical protein
MPLTEITLELDNIQLPLSARTLIGDAQERIDSLDNALSIQIPAFVPSDFALVYRALAAIQASHLATGRRFAEWGSGIGVIACLATQLGFDAVGIEVERPLVDIARTLAATHDLDTQFIHGTFVPPGAELQYASNNDLVWLTTSGSSAYEELDCEPDDFDIIFAYPWPGEEQIIFDLFTDHAATGALLLTYHGLEGVRLQRKTRS